MSCEKPSQVTFTCTESCNNQDKGSCGENYTFNYNKGESCSFGVVNSNGAGQGLSIPDGTSTQTPIADGQVSLDSRGGQCRADFTRSSLSTKNTILSAGKSLEKSIHSRDKKSSLKSLEKTKKHLVQLQENLDKEGKQNLGDEVEKILDQVDKNIRQGKKKEWNKNNLIGMHGLLHDVYRKSK